MIDKIIEGIISLIKGMLVTLKYFILRPATMQYPKAKWRLPDRYRGALSLILDEKTGTHKCISCLSCVRICPNHCLEHKFKVDENKKRQVEEFTINLGRCMFCGLCVEACPTDALEMNKEYELAVYSVDKFTRSLI
ncbi:MAG: NADH-quinone oxidoreductase subunit I [Candidatus Stahlbacteria bacterium]|nr:NADH-quinone oxidoreductase subunit I [Candidatus Stahlbacteria bacterium]